MTDIATPTAMRPALSARRRPLIRPVSRVALRLTDQNAFESAISETVKWMNAPARCDGAIPNEAFSGEPFDLVHEVGALPAAAAIFREGEQRIWATKLDFPDRTVGQRTWSTEITISNIGRATHFVAKLTNITRAEDPPYAPSIPGIVRTITSTLSADADGFSVSDEPFIADMNSISDFEGLLLNENRRLPIIALSEDECGRTLTDARDILKRLSGAAHVVVINADVSWQLTRTYGSPFSTFGGASRIYWPNFDPENDDPFRHPLTKPSRNFDQSDFMDWLCRRILPSSFTQIEKDDRPNGYVAVRSLSAQKIREKSLHVDDQNELREIVAILEEEIRSLSRSRSDDSEAALALLEESEENYLSSEQEKAELAEENDRLRARVRSLSAQRTAAAAEQNDNALNSFDDFQTWCDENLGDHVEIKSRAIRETIKHGTPEILSRVTETLLLIRDYYVPMRTSSTSELHKKFKAKCEEIGVEESACFSKKGDIKNHIGYSTRSGTRKLWLDRHFKYGLGFDMRRMFRIYYTWDEDSERVIIGHMPTHLDNNNTN